MGYHVSFTRETPNLYEVLFTAKPYAHNAEAERNHAWKSPVIGWVCSGPDWQPSVVPVVLYRGVAVVADLMHERFSKHAVDWRIRRVRDEDEEQ